MSDNTVNDSGRGNAVIYWVAGALVVVLMVVGLVAYRGAEESKDADAKADQFLTVLQQAGVEHLPSRDQVVRVLGDDGGSVCEDPGNALRQATLYSMIVNGASGPGMRPIITDSLLLRGQLAVISVYCPDELDDVKDYLDDLETDDVVRG